MSERSTSATVVYGILAALVAVGLGVGIVRLINGMGPTTALTDSYPWGLWILYDLFFVPFSAGAFMILAVAHVYNREEYHAIARPVVLAGFLGEIMIVAVLVMDLGRWNQFYNVLLPWNWNLRSFMFQVSLCLTVYLGVMLLEMAPAILERFNLQKPLRVIRTLTVAIAGAGIVLSCLHQSSLGSLFLLMPYKLDALWWTPLLPLLFLVSALFSGLAMAIFVALVTFHAFRRPLKLRLLSNLARVAAVILGLYLVLRLGDLLVRGESAAIFTSGTLSLLFVAEILVGVVVPLLLFGIPRFRESSRGLLWGSVSILAGILLNRANVALLGEHVATGGGYVPYWMEIAISVAAIAGGVLLFCLAVCTLPILPASAKRAGHPEPVGLHRRAILPLAGVLVVLTPLVVVGLQPAVHGGTVRHGTASVRQAEAAGGVENCRDCHTSTDDLLAAGATQEDLTWLVVEPEEASTPHGQLDCVTCHHSNGLAQDVEAAHDEVIADPSREDTHTCLSCHIDLPDEIPQDRLRTPHNEIAHGEAVDVYCSDCHGGVGHGFDPMTGNVICPMTACLDCHISRQLDSKLTDCNACHITAHNPAPVMACQSCHQSTEAWQAVVPIESHPVTLDGQHATVQCLDCHVSRQLGSELVDCSACHITAHDPAPVMACQACHQSTEAWQAVVPIESHPVTLDGQHATVPCLDCHQRPALGAACADCHQSPEDHATDPCDACHTTQGWMASVASLAPTMAHEIASLENCVLCHVAGSPIKPAPASHADYDNEQCLTCHQAPAVAHDLYPATSCMVCHDPAGNVKPAPVGHVGYTDEECLTCHLTE